MEDCVLRYRQGGNPGMMTEEEVEKRLDALNHEEIPEALSRYIEAQSKLNDAQGFVPQELLSSVEEAKEDYLKLREEREELLRMLSYARH